jgi:membrane-associated phospholipid phosphatase
VRYARDAVSVWTAPLSWTGGEWALAGGLAAAGFGLYSSDDRLRRDAQENRSRDTNRVSDFARPLGDYWAIGGAAALWAGGSLAGAGRVARFGNLGLESAAIAGLTGFIVKCAARRSRPYAGRGRAVWGSGPGIHAGSSNLSFPSGHSETAFALATVAACEWADYPLVGTLALGLATLTALSRVNDDKHWTSDILAGSALGAATGLAVWRANSGLSRQALRPAVAGGAPALAFEAGW